MSGAHTEGPWLVAMRRDDAGTTVYSVWLHDKTLVAVANDGSYWPKGYEATVDADGYTLPDDEMDCTPSKVANARLIAAAPDLLDALESLEKWFDTDAEILAAMSEADRADNARQLAKIRAAIAKARGNT
jgi:hypothetical protein